MKTVLSFKVAATLSAYRIVCLNGTENTVAYQTTAQQLPVGITIDTVKDTNQGIPVAVAGSIAKLSFIDSVTSGTLVTSDMSTGQGVPLAHPTTSTSETLSAAYVGVLIGATVNTTGTVADVLVMPGFIRGST